MVKSKRPSLSANTPGMIDRAMGTERQSPKDLDEVFDILDNSEDFDISERQLCTIKDLCRLLLRLEIRGTEANAKGLGQLPDSQDRDFRHHIYNQQSLVEKKSSLPLRTLLSSNTEFAHDDKLYAAYHLACSLLHLHLPAWAKDGWTSSNLMLMRAQSKPQNSNEDWVLFSEDLQEIQHKSQHRLREIIGEAIDIEPAHITRLGIILLEMGQDEPLREGLSDEETTKKARELIQSDMIIKHIGRRYWRVVNYCLNWRNKTRLSENLRDIVVQRRFYDEIVQHLKLNIFDFSGTSVF